MKFVFCEGKNDQLVIQSLTKHLGLDVKVEWTGGKDKISTFLESLPKRPEFAQQKVNAIAIFRDADNDAIASFQSVRDSLQRNGFTPPQNHALFSESILRIGVFIVGIDGRGMMEDLCLASVADQPEFSCVDSYFDCIAKKSSRSRFSSKAKVRVWMASHVDFEYHVGKAAEEGYWSWEHSIFEPLKNFLKAM